MSMNIHIIAFRKVYTKSGRESEQSEFFNCYQTPTVVSEAILDSDNPIQAYKEWVLSNGCDKEIVVYAEDDIFGENTPIGTDIVNYAKQHCEELDDWISKMEEEEYEIKVFML